MIKTTEIDWKDPEITLKKYTFVDKEYEMPHYGLIDIPTTSFMGVFICLNHKKYKNKFVRKKLCSGEFCSLPVYDPIILINTRLSGRMKRAVVAHEWRHYWQFANGWNYDGIPVDDRMFYIDTYWDFVYDYFTKSKSEMDALLFSLEHAPCKHDSKILKYIKERDNYE
jgi:hypothetical protein